MAKKKTHEQFLEELCEKNEHYRNGVFIVIEKYRSVKTKILIEDNCGKLMILAESLLDGKRPTIQSAINKNQYIINKFKEIHGDIHGYDKVEYVNTRTNVEIYCKVHKEYFQQRVGHHLRKHGCPKCGKEKSASQSKKNPTGWTHTNWCNREESIYFDAYKVYIIKCWNDEEEFYKIGRTLQSIKGRFGIKLTKKTTLQL